jgi:cytochrome c553
MRVALETCAGLAVVVFAAANIAWADQQAGIEFFESNVRPLLVERCYECHSAKSDPIEGGLRLDSRAGWQRGGDSGPVIVPGQPEESRLLKAVLYQDPTLAMPPDNALSKREIDLIRNWIEIGAPDPRGQEEKAGSRAIDFEAGREFWSFRPIANPQLPAIENRDWAQSPIDHFVLANLEESGLAPVPPASPRVLIRRTTFDLIGLPPTPEEIEVFLQESNRDPQSAFRNLIDRLLVSPHYGERWGRHWLDVARYADDQLRVEFFYRDLPHAWRYRDWVVRALNDDMPYDQFVMQQLAGDLLVDSFGPESTVATGFLALGMIYQDDGGTPESIAVAKAETLDDRVDTVTRGLLGLTVSCARCHDHKFDPIPTADYYSLAGIFQNTKYVEEAPLVEREIVDRYAKARQAIAEIEGKLAEAEKAEDVEQIAALKQQLNQQEQTAPPIYPRAHAMLEGGSEDMRVALRGNLLKPGELAPRRFLRVVAGDDPPRFTQGSGRIELARAIASENNPLTARVIANRIWQHHFGRGIVASASNFGELGARPTHPELLDWLASRLIESGWSLKSLHREILLSSTYQLSTRYDEHNHRIDSGNKWLWRMNRRRLDIEAIRDSVLAASGELDQRLGGVPVSDLLTSHRRTIYGAVRRDKQTNSDELLRMFDFPNPRISSAGRSSTTVPQQQLFSLNSKFMIERAGALAARAQRESPNASIQHAFLLVLSREPSNEELALADSFINADSAEPADEFSLWEQFCQVLISSNEALYRP